MLALAIGAILGLTGAGAFVGWAKKKDEEKGKIPPTYVPPGTRVAATGPAILAPIATTAVTPDKLQTLRTIVAKALTMVPLTDAERANGVNTAIAAGMPALATALRSGSITDIAKAAVGL